MAFKNCASLLTQKDDIEKTLNSHVQPQAKSNSESKVSVNTACQSDAMKDALAKCSPQHDSGSKVTQKPATTATPAKKEGTSASTHKLEVQSTKTGKKMIAIDYQVYQSTYLNGTRRKNDINVLQRFSIMTMM
jgi:hypothetical protein